jgi:hypothetical protein
MNVRTPTVTILAAVLAVLTLASSAWLGRTKERTQPGG